MKNSINSTKMPFDFKLRSNLMVFSSVELVGKKVSICSKIHILKGCEIWPIGQWETDAWNQGEGEKKKTGMSRVNIKNVLTQHRVGT
jgi:hypothetical protein